MNGYNFRSRLLATSLFVASAFWFGGMAAQGQETEDPPVEVVDELEDDVSVQQRVVVTGSRLRRDEYSSISPLQVVDADEGRAVGLFEIGDLISQSSTVTGIQFDGSVNAGSPTAAVEGVSEGGVGSNNVALRGLGASSTLLLVNGRRLGRSGVRGAPVAPDLNLIPSAIVERVEVLTDGASSIYGSDAVAGVVNVILRDEYEGFEVSGAVTEPFDEGGEETQLAFIGGASNDRGRFTVAGEFYNRNAVIAGERGDFNDCLRDIEVGEDGQIFSTCLDARPDNAVFIGSQGFVFSTPGSTDIGVPGFSSQDGLGENFRQNALFNLQDEERATQLLEGLERYNLYATGEFDLNLFTRDTVYFEASYSERSSIGRFTNEQIFPGVPGQIPQEDANGNLLVNPDGSLQLFDNPLNPFDEDALPVITTPVLAQRRSSDLSNFRFVAGLEGDIGLDWFQQNNWVYDVSASYERSFGVASQPVLFENNIREALDTLRLDADGNPVCGLGRSATSFGFLTPSDCVPVNFFADSLFTTTGGDKTFATDEETEFISGDSINTTEIETGIVTAIATGNVFELPGGPVGVLFGAEFREERIATVNDVVRVNGLAASEVPDQEGNTNGRVGQFDIFAETEFPVTKQLTLNLSGRYADTELSGEEFVYSVRGQWAPTDYLSFRGTFGTTFRAPDLRALFLSGTVGTIAGGNDPCVVPNEADVNDVFVPENDDRPQVVIDNCIASGADPTALGLQAVTGIPFTTGGNMDLEPETSDSYTLGLVFQQPFTDVFDADLSLTYFNIEVEDRILETNPSTVLNRCFNDEPGLASPFCDFVTRNTGDPSTATIANIASPFINVGEVTSEGLDINVRLGIDTDRFLPGGRLSYNVSATNQFEQKEVINADDPGDDNAGEIGTPDWQGVGTAAFDYNQWTLRFRSRYIGDGQQDDSDPFTAPADQSPVASACGILGATVGCRDVDFIDDYWTHDLSASYSRDDWTLTLGIRNLFDAEVPLIDQGEGPSRINIVTQSGHDLIGRRVFLNASKRF